MNLPKLLKSLVRTKDKMPTDETSVGKVDQVTHVTGLTDENSLPGNQSPNPRLDLEYQEDSPTGEADKRLATETEANTKDPAHPEKLEKSTSLSKAEIEDRYTRKQIRRQITTEFVVLRRLGNQCSPQQIAEFIFRHYQNIDLMREALAPEKYSEQLASVLVWRYLAEDASKDLDQLYIEQKLRVERQSWFEGMIREPITVLVGCDEQGPKMVDVSIDQLTSLIKEMLKDSSQVLTLSLQEPISQLGDHKFCIELPTGEIFRRTLSLVANYRDINLDDFPEIKQAAIIPSKVGEDPLEWLESLLSEQTSDDFIENFHGLTSVLATAFHMGYWLLPWTQSLYQDWQSQLEVVRKGQDITSEFGATLSKVLEVPYPFGRGTIVSEIAKRIRVATNIVKRDIARLEIGNDAIHPVSKFGRLIKETESWRTNGTSDTEIADRYLLHVKKYIFTTQDSLASYCLAEYCFYKGRLLYKDKKPSEARAYFYVFLLLHAQSPLNIQSELQDHHYLSLVYYFGTFNLILRDSFESTGTVDWFYPALYAMLQNRPKQQRELGYCLLGLAVVSQRWVLDLINRLKTRPDLEKPLKIILSSLQEPTVFNSEPYHCMQILARIDIAAFPSILARQPLSSRQYSAEQRRLTAIALLRVANNMAGGEYTSLVDGLPNLATSETISALGFSLLVEPFILNAPEKEADMKANLLVEAYGFPPGTKSTEVFQARMKDLATLFDRFNQAQDPNIKGRFGTSIQDNIRLTRRYLIENIPASRADMAIMLFRRLEAHVTTELAKLIHDTRVEIVLVNDRALFVPGNTRIIIEIRNVGEGIADSLELEIKPVEGQYDVAEWHRKQTVESLTERAMEQREVFIMPKVDVNNNVELDIALQYNTLKQKEKQAQLPQNQHTVWLYPETEFIRVPQTYNITEPATTWFYGRHDTLQSMADNLSSETGGADHNTSMIVYGLKRAGKTSVVKRFITHTLRERHLDNNFISVYVDFLKDVQISDIRNDGDFLYFIMQSIVRVLPFEHRIFDPDDRQFHDKFTTAPYKEFLSSLERILAQLNGRKILLVLDEFSQLRDRLSTDHQDGLSPRVFSFLSNTIQSTNQLAFVFTGTYVLNEMMREHAFDLAKICVPKLISFLDDNAARRLVTEPVARDKNHPERGYLAFQANVVDRIVHVTNRHPYLIQYLCKLLVDRMNSEIKHPQVNLNDINTVIAEVVSRPSHDTTFLSFWNDFDKSQRKVLAVVAAGTKRNLYQPWININDIAEVFQDFQDPIDFEELLRLCSSLEDAEMLERSPGDDSYRISIPLYQAWLSQNSSITALFGDVVKD
jgi:hypothetical protein